MLIELIANLKALLNEWNKPPHSWTSKPIVFTEPSDYQGLVCLDELENH